MAWKILTKRTAQKQYKKLPTHIQAVFLLLLEDLAAYGPTAGGTWKHYGKLKGKGFDSRHCHLNKGKPTYVCCWEVKDKAIQIIEVYYAGTHEKAPY